MTITPDDLARAGLHVKPLEWVRELGGWQAKTAIGNYWTPANGSDVRRNAICLGTPNGLRVARSIAQADYESRILAALAFVPRLLPAPWGMR